MTDFPDGLAHQHERHSAAGGVRNYLAIIILGGILALAFAGVFGGNASPMYIVDTPEASLSIKTPRTLRNGLFFETRSRVGAKADLRAVAIAVSPTLWRDMTINSMVPQASQESFEHGRFVFRYGPLKKGDHLDLKVDGQINPPLFAGTNGEIALLDGDRQLASLPLNVKVMP